MFLRFLGATTPCFQHSRQRKGGVVTERNHQALLGLELHRKEAKLISLAGVHHVPCTVLYLDNSSIFLYVASFQVNLRAVLKL